MTTAPSAGNAASAAVPSAAPLDLTWSKQATPLEAIERALYALADQVSGTVTGTGDTWTVHIYPRGATADPQVLAHQLRQSVVDHTLRLRIAERTDPVRNLVFAMAFSRSGLGPSRDSESTGDVGA